MKGISHFAAGVAVASCFPGVVESGAAGNPLYFILGGAFGLLPDTLDFKIGRFFYRHDMQVVPDPLRPDPRMIADAVAMAANEAQAAGKPVRIRLHTIRIGADAWQSYTVAFDVSGRKVRVEYGPVVNTGGQPIEWGGRPTGQRADAALACDIRLEYEAVTKVDIFDGPIFEMVPSRNGMVSPVFIPWHRQWSHSIPMAVGFGLAAGMIWGFMAGLVAAAAYAAHAILDQLGYMGSNLFFPFTSRRSSGLRLTHSSEVLANLATVWLSCLVIFWNLYSAGTLRVPDLNWMKLLFHGAAVPLVAFLLLRRLVNGRKEAGAPWKR